MNQEREKKETEDQDKLAEEWAAALGDQEDPQEDLAEVDQQSEEEAEDDNLADEWAKALAAEEEEKIKDEKTQQSISAQSKEPQFKDMTAEAKKKPEGTKRDLEFILDIPLTVTAQLGSTQLLINELLQLGQGSVIELNKLAGEPLEIHVNGKLVARGEAVVINEKFGVRLTDIISPIERIKQLG
ncbi:flagellar motor switch protein FliN [Desulfonatronovibrio hydrogenovorans]|uniref:flagellar motor switch protein FliN n=1 Tax=Desulfonatronovibrio hydrogenovorans TaxID=53245 RepID=UPI00048BF530|nr:flagellar motor switch protein FliN [Desulfonatronovibrio hydrogenovorans]